MMLHNGLFWLLATGHLLGEFYVKLPALAQNDGKGLRPRIAHMACYALIAALSLWPIAFGRGPWTAYLLVWVAVAGAHAAIDFARDTWIAPRAGERAAFFAGQGLQLAVILAATLVFRSQVGRALMNPLGDRVRYLIMDYIIKDIRALALLQYLCIFLFIGKPAAQALRMALSDPRDLAAANGAGDLIGVLERVFVVLLMFAQQYTAIALVFLVKTVAFHGRDIRDGQAVDRYLLATFASVLLAVAIALLAEPAKPPFEEIYPEMAGNG